MYYPNFLFPSFSLINISFKINDRFIDYNCMPACLGLFHVMG